ncbi:MAG: hypothetical protein AB1728_15735 [Bacteroidota bacterium]
MTELASFYGCSYICTMQRFLKNIVRYSVTGFLLIAVSGFTFVVQHEHPINAATKERTEHPHSEEADEHQQNTPSTYHEIHFVKFSSGDQFNTSPPTDIRFSSFVTLFVIQPDLFDSFSNLHSTSLINAANWETRPPSRDKCALFCSFLI